MTRTCFGIINFKIIKSKKYLPVAGSRAMEGGGLGGSASTSKPDGIIHIFTAHTNTRSSSRTRSQTEKYDLKRECAHVHTINESALSARTHSHTHTHNICSPFAPALTPIPACSRSRIHFCNNATRARRRCACVVYGNVYTKNKIL